MNCVIRKKRQHQNIDTFSMGLLALMINFSVIIGIFQIMQDNKIMGFQYLPSFQTVLFNIIFILLTCFVIIRKRDYKAPCLMITIYFFLLLLSEIICPQIGIISLRAIAYFIRNVWCISVLFTQVTDEGYFFSKLKFYIPFALLYAALELWTWEGNKSYDMGFTYAIAVPIVVTMLDVKKGSRYNIFYVLSLAFFFYVILKCGSRSGLLYVAFAILLIYFYKNVSEKVVTIGILAVALLVIYFFKDNILGYLFMHFTDSRNISLLERRLLFYDAGRFKYYTLLLQSVIGMPFTIRGLYSDRVYFCDFYGFNGVKEMWGSYAHNIYIEILFQFGIISIPFMAYGTYQVVKIIVYAKRNIQLQKIVIVFFSVSILQLMISSSYLITGSFGFILGIYGLYRKKKAIRDYS